MAFGVSAQSAAKGLASIALRPKVDPPLRKILNQCRQTFVFLFMLTAVIEFLNLAPILYMLNVYERVLSSRSLTTLMSLTVVVFSIMIFWSALEWIRSRLMVRLSLRIDWDIAPDVFDASFRRYANRKNVDVQQLLGDMLSVRQFLTGTPLLALMSVPFAPVFIIIAGMFHWGLAVFAFVMSVVILVTTYISLKLSGPILREANDSSSEANRVASASLKHAETTLAMGMLGAVRKRWYAYHRKFLTKQVFASEASGLAGGLTGFITKTSRPLFIGYSALLAIEGAITGGMMIVAMMLMGKSIQPLNQILSSWQDIVKARQAYDRLNELLADDEAYKSAMELPPPLGKLDVAELVGVPPGHNEAVLQGIQFSLEPGQILAVVGPSAAGKSSLVKLLLGLWKPAHGSARLDGVELSEWSHEEVGPRVGYVPQEVDFFEGTVAENIARLGEVDAEQVVKAAQLIGMHEAILAMPQGYETPLGDTDFAMSGGQRQRVAIARAIYGMPKYVVMDEPNSNLDEVGEAALMKVLEALKANGSTVVLTTHRPRLMTAVDRMLVLRSGRQVAFGPANEILDAVRKLQAVPGGAAPNAQPPNTPAVDGPGGTKPTGAAGGAA